MAGTEEWGTKTSLITDEGHPAYALIERLKGEIQGRILPHEPLSCHTTWRIGGPADLLVAPANAAELVTVLRWIKELKLPWLILGNGSNILFRDGGFRGVVIKLAGSLTTYHFQENILKAEAGVMMSLLAREAAKRNLSGLEYAGALPATLGGALVMNAGAHGQEIAPLVREVVGIDKEGNFTNLSPGQLGYGYRTSRLQQGGIVVVAATLVLAPGDGEAIRRRMEANSQSRKEKQPLSQPNAGSVFQNPPGHSAGRLIEEAGCKGWTEGDAEVSPVHANFIVNRGRATARQVLTLMERVQEEVRRRFGVDLKSEVRILGEE